MIAIQTSERNGALVGAVQLLDDQEIMLISDQGTLVRTRAAEIARVGRNTQGVTLIRLRNGEQLVGIEAVTAFEEEIEELNDMPSVDTSPTNADSGEPNVDSVPAA